MGLSFVNVSTGSHLVPADEARRLISNCAGLLAVATRRDQLVSGDFKMPDAVHDEISIAYALKKPILILAEDSVRLEGFMGSFSTYARFDRNRMFEPDEVRRLVGSVYTFRAALRGERSPLSTEGSAYHSERTTHLITLDKQPDGFEWSLSMTKRLRFDLPFSRELITGTRPTVPVKVRENAPNLSWEVHIDDSSRDFELRATVKNIGPAKVEVACRFIPDPQPGDFIEFTRICRSSCVNPVYMSDLLEPDVSAIEIDGKKYLAFSGFVPVEPTHRFAARFSLPRSYKIKRRDVVLFSASYNNLIQYLTPSELGRATHRVEWFGNEILAELEIDHPLPHHMYGIAWNPPQAPSAA